MNRKMTLRIVLLVELLGIFQSCAFDDMATSLLRHYMDLCGPQSLCDPTRIMDPGLPLIGSEYCTPCSLCYCDEFCGSIGDCCLDKKLENHTSNEIDIACIMSVNIDDIRLVDHRETENRYAVIQNCPKDHADMVLRTKCENVTDSVLSRTPVTSNNSAASFRNVFCFLCNGESGPIFWDMRIRDVEMELMDNVLFSMSSSIDEIILEAKKFNRTIIEFIPNEKVKARFCEKDSLERCPQNSSAALEWGCHNIKFALTPHYFNPFCNACNSYSSPIPIPIPIRTSCNETGLWQYYDRHILEGCENGPYVLGFYLEYKNIYCYLCNFDGFETEECTASINLQPTVFFGYLFDLSSIFGNVIIGKKDLTQCKQNEVYDPYQVRIAF